MRKNRIAYAVTLIILLLLLFFFSEPYLGCAAGILLILAAVSYVLLRKDVNELELELYVRSGGQVGKHVPCELKIHRNSKMATLRGILFELDIDNALFKKNKKQVFYAELSADQEVVQIPYEASRCGEITFRSISVKAVDQMGLFTVRMPALKEKRMMIYPYTLQTDIKLSKAKSGSTLHEGAMLNQKGTDSSEMFDVREYVPGDDVRAIHWKLSGKYDTTMLREASEPVHYQIALLPDIGRKNGEHRVSAEEINACIAVGESISYTLLEQGISFGVVLPTKTGLYLREINSRKDINIMMTEWLSMPLQEESGAGFKYFMHEQLQQYFTSVLILSAGRYAALPAGVDSYMGVTVVNTVDGTKHEMVYHSGNSEIFDLPARPSKEIYFLNC